MKIPMETRVKLVSEAGEDIRDLVDRVVRNGSLTRGGIVALCQVIYGAGVEKGFDEAQKGKR